LEKNFNGPENTGDEALCMMLNRNGDIYVTGFCGNTKSKRRRCIIKYNSSGDEVWKLISPKPVSTYTEKFSMVFDSNENILVTSSGKFTGKNIPSEMGIDCFSPEGGLLWQIYYEGPENSLPVALSAAADADDSVYLTGYVMGINGGYINYCTVKFSK
jgi:hypothetical protein